MKSKKLHFVLFLFFLLLFFSCRKECAKSSTGSVSFYTARTGTWWLDIDDRLVGSLTSGNEYSESAIKAGLHPYSAKRFSPAATINGSFFVNECRGIAVEIK